MPATEAMVPPQNRSLKTTSQDLSTMQQQQKIDSFTLNLKGVVFMKQIVRFLLVAAVVATFSMTTARADAVTDWNAIAVQATITGARPGPTGVLDIAMAPSRPFTTPSRLLTGGSNRITWRSPGASGSPAAATAKAAHDVLVTAFLRRPHPSTRPTTRTCSTMVCPRPILE